MAVGGSSWFLGGFSLKPRSASRANQPWPGAWVAPRARFGPMFSRMRRSSCRDRNA